MDEPYFVTWVVIADELDVTPRTAQRYARAPKKGMKRLELDVNHKGNVVISKAALEEWKKANLRKHGSEPVGQVVP